MKHTHQWIIAILTILLIGALAGLAYVTWWAPKDADQTKPDESSTTQMDGPNTTGTHTFSSAKGVTIELDNWPNNNTVTSPLTITGKVPGSWSFEGSFPIDVVYEGDIGVPGATATLQGDWTTTAMVPFTATLTFDETTMASDDVTLYLRKANPSGLPENDDSVAIDIHFSR